MVGKLDKAHEWIVRAVRAILPIPQMEGASTYTERYSAIPQFIDVFQKLRKTIDGADKSKQRCLYEHAKNYLGDENDRGASIMSRAQALLIAQTFFGAFLAFGTGIMGRTESFRGWLALVLILLLIYTVTLVLLLTFNALRATAGLRYPRIGTSDLVSAFQGTNERLIKELALLTLDNYRVASIVNTWRMTHLQRAQECLGRIVVALALLVGVVFWAVITQEPPAAYFHWIIAAGQ